MPTYRKKKDKTFSSQKKTVNLQPFCTKLNKAINKYNIAIQGLADKRHIFEFEGDDRFFASFEQDIIENGSFKAVITLDKSATMLRLQFDIQAAIGLLCDRSLDEYTENITLSEQYLYKFGHKHEVIDESIEIIPFGESEINVAQHLFDFIALAVPMKKLHPRFRAEEEEENDFGFEENTKNEKDNHTQQETDSSDPRWAALKSLLNK